MQFVRQDNSPSGRSFTRTNVDRNNMDNWENGIHKQGKFPSKLVLIIIKSYLGTDFSVKHT